MTILSGTEFGYTLGTPVGLLVMNEDQRPGDYKEMSEIPRPGHADFTYQLKYGNRASSGGGRSSARETIGRVAAGAIAEKWLHETYGTEISCWVSSIGPISMPDDAVPFSRGGRGWTREQARHARDTQAAAPSLARAPPAPTPPSPPRHRWTRLAACACSALRRAGTS